MSNDFLFTSESVSEGHPDKISDQISDAVLDEIIRYDKSAKVACETLVKTGMVLVTGEITTFHNFDIEKIVRKIINDIGYNDAFGFNGQSCAVITSIGKQSPDIAQGISDNNINQGAGDQGIMFGFATDETPTLMPAAIYYAHKIMERHSQLRKNNTIPWLGPDAKSQVTLKYSNNTPVGLDTVVVSTQHLPDVKYKDIKEQVINNIIIPVFPSSWISKNTKYIVNPNGQFVIGGPVGDCGLSGRKIIVDSYGGYAHHGGGSFSGKDPSKVDRSAAYMARYIAKNIVAYKLAKKVEIQISYAIGLPQPTSIMLNTFGTENISNQKIKSLIVENFDLRPYAIIKKLNLLRPIYQRTACYGHFGREDQDFAWEKIDSNFLGNKL